MAAEAESVASAPDGVLLAVDDVTAGYGAAEVLHGVSVAAPAGTVAAVVGANGAGKTTLMAVVSGLLGCRSGTVTVGGRDVTALGAAGRVREGLSLVPEGRKIFARLTVAENLLIGAHTRTDAAEIAEGLDRAYSLFPVLGERRRQQGGTLSGGEQQMLALARALMSRPRVLLLDEPSMGVAPLLTERIFGVIAGLRKEGMTILLVEQNAELALAVADSAYVVETGRVVLSGAARDLASDPQVIASYMGG